MFNRAVYQLAQARLRESRRFIQVLAGPRQVGKTTLAQQLAEALGIPYHYAAADEPMVGNHTWIEQQWEIGRLRVRTGKPALLILDEVQKIEEWSTIVKRLWDEDTRERRPLKVILLGSAPLLIQRGLTESLSGRFEIIPISHWSFTEMQQAFGWTLHQYIYFGAYPGAAGLINDELRWKQYITHSLIETTISRDILLMNPIHKPALLRRLFHLGCHYSSQILSYQKMLGQLKDAGNTTTLAHYLQLLSGAGMVTGLHKFAGQIVRQRASSPKLQVLNTALLSAQADYSFAGAEQDREFWGRLFESAIGAHLINSAAGTAVKVFYWREGSQEVDFVLQAGKKLVAIEVKSGRHKETMPGIESFKKIFKPQRILLVGGQGISAEEFLKTPLLRWFE